MLRHLRETEAGKHTVIVYTSDHGEAFREHGQMGHTFSIFEEETHVPMWIDAPPGTLTHDEDREPRDRSATRTFSTSTSPPPSSTSWAWDARPASKNTGSACSATACCGRS